MRYSKHPDRSEGGRRAIAVLLPALAVTAIGFLVLTNVGPEQEGFSSAEPRKAGGGPVGLARDGRVTAAEEKGARQLVEADVPEREIVVRVLDMSGNPIAGAEVSVYEGSSLVEGIGADAVPMHRASFPCMLANGKVGLVPLPEAIRHRGELVAEHLLSIGFTNSRGLWKDRIPERPLGVVVRATHGMAEIIQEGMGYEFSFVLNTELNECRGRVVGLRKNERLWVALVAPGSRAFSVSRVDADGYFSAVPPSRLFGAAPVGNPRVELVGHSPLFEGDAEIRLLCKYAPVLRVVDAESVARNELLMVVVPPGRGGVARLRRSFGADGWHKLPNFIEQITDPECRIYLIGQDGTQTSVEIGALKEASDWGGVELQLRNAPVCRQVIRILGDKGIEFRIYGRIVSYDDVNADLPGVSFVSSMNNSGTSCSVEVIPGAMYDIEVSDVRTGNQLAMVRRVVSGDGELAINLNSRFKVRVRGEGESAESIDSVLYCEQGQPSIELRDGGQEEWVHNGAVDQSRIAVTFDGAGEAIVYPVVWDGSDEVVIEIARNNDPTSKDVEAYLVDSNFAPIEGSVEARGVKRSEVRKGGTCKVPRQGPYFVEAAGTQFDIDSLTSFGERLFLVCPMETLGDGMILTAEIEGRSAAVQSVRISKKAGNWRVVYWRKDEAGLGLRIRVPESSGYLSIDVEGYGRFLLDVRGSELLWRNDALVFKCPALGEIHGYEWITVDVEPVSEGSWVKGGLATCYRLSDTCWWIPMRGFSRTMEGQKAEVRLVRDRECVLVWESVRGQLRGLRVDMGVGGREYTVHRESEDHLQVPWVR